MGRIKVVSNNKELRSAIQEEVSGFSENAEIYAILAHITNKYDCNADLLYPKQPGGIRYVYCYFPE